jgi:hypothetical protein
LLKARIESEREAFGHSPAHNSPFRPGDRPPHHQDVTVDDTGALQVSAAAQQYHVAADLPGCSKFPSHQKHVAVYQAVWSQPYISAKCYEIATDLLFFSQLEILTEENLVTATIPGQGRRHHRQQQSHRTYQNS